MLCLECEQHYKENEMATANMQWTEMDRMWLSERALDILGEVAENKRECGGYPAKNWAWHVAEEELLISQKKERENG